MSLPTQTMTRHDLLPRPDKEKLCATFVGQPLSSVRSPAAVIDRSVYRENCARMGRLVQEKGYRFRCHIKTHKTVEGVRIQLDDGKISKSIVCSTLAECWHIAKSDLVSQGVVDDVSQPSLSLSK
jgi:D-serine deaminase-like pyridoxal phosphate-dependent protein